MPFIPLLLKDNLGIVDDNVRGLYVAIYQFASMLSLCVGTSVWGILADKFGRKLMLLRASYCAAFLYPLLVFAPNFATLVIIRFVVSFFSGTVNPAQTLLVSNTPEEKHGFVLGTLSTSVWSGNMTGYLLGGFIAEFFGYTAAFLTCGGMYLSSAVLIQFFVKEQFVKPVKTENVSRKKNPEHSFRKLATPAVVWILILFFVMGIARRIDEPFIAMMVETVNGAKRAAFYTGVASASAALGGVISGVWIGNLCDKYSVYKLIPTILIFSTAAMAAHALSMNIAMLIITRFLVFFAAGGIQPIFQVMLSRVTAPELRGSYFGFSAGVNQFGGLVCAACSGAVAYFMNVRGIFLTSALFYFLMIPLVIPAIRLCRKEEVKFHKPES